MTVVFGIVCVCGLERWELKEIYVSFLSASERVEELTKRYPSERFFITSKNLVE